jgi:glucose-6-phosphate dehydrogenase assembly protein OpcA
MSWLEPAVTEEQAVHRRLMQFGEHASLATPLWEARDTSVRTIAAYLASLWEPPAHSDERGDPLVTEKGLPHARASVLNLIVTVNDDGAADRIVRTLLDLGVRHPSRAIVLVPQPGAGTRPLDARISTHCHDLPADGERMCYEEVILTVRGEAADHLSGIVAPLLIHDLPTHVWWPGDPPFNDPVFDQLVEMGDRVLFDSSDFGDLLGGLRRLGTLRHASGVGDFRRYLPNLSRLLISYAVPLRDAGMLPGEPNDTAAGVASPMAQALLYAGWIATRLGWRRYRTVQPLQDGAFRLTLEGRHEMIDLAIRPEPTAAVRAGEVMSIRLRSLGETGAAEFIIDRTGDIGVVATNAVGMTALLRRVGMETPREAELLSAQLTNDVVDPIYENALRAAAIILASARESPG